jgi:hypothetical protein
MKGVTASELLKQEKKILPIVTMCEELDRMLGGGIPLGKITEFCMDDRRFIFISSKIHLKFRFFF